MLPTNIEKRIFMYLAYSDETFDKDCGFAMVGAILIEDKLFAMIETMAGAVVERLIPLDKLARFEEFHAADLYGGHGAFEGIDEKERFEAIEILLEVVKGSEMTFVYSAVDTRALSLSAFGAANPLDVAFRMCIRGIEQQIAPKASDATLCLLIMDETKDAALKHQLKVSFKSVRGRPSPPNWIPRQLWHFHDDMYFGDSRDSIGIQIADLCNCFVARRLKIRGNSDKFYNIFSERVICSKAEPEWSQFRGSFLEIGIQIAR
jgi:Protein of unknown function (DUF3800)